MRQKLSNAAIARLVLLLALVWLWLCALTLFERWSWATVVVFLGLAYFSFRLVYEAFFNRIALPTLASGFFVRNKIVSVVSRDAATRGLNPYTVIDLGSGRGELARRLAKRIPKAKVIGVELAPLPYRQALWLQRLFGPPNLSFRQGDFWTFDCTDIDAVVLYIGPVSAQRMGEKLRKELKPGSLIVSNTYPLLGTWTPLETLTFFAPFKETLYIYRQ